MEIECLAQYLENSRKKRSIWEHPITITLVGFCLTGGIGWALTSWYQANQAEKERQFREFAASVSAIDSFSDTAFERYVRAGLLKAAIERRTKPDEVQRRKQVYDEALVRYESTTQLKMLAIRQALKRSEYSNFEDYVECGLKPVFKLLDDSLTKAVDTYEQAAPVPSREDQLLCANEAYRRTLACTGALTSAVYMFVSSTQYKAGTAITDTQNQALGDVQRECPRKLEIPACAYLHEKPPILLPGHCVGR